PAAGTGRAERPATGLRRPSGVAAAHVAAGPPPAQAGRRPTGQEPLRCAGPAAQCPGQGSAPGAVQPGHPHPPRVLPRAGRRRLRPALSSASLPSRPDGGSVSVVTTAGPARSSAPSAPRLRGRAAPADPPTVAPAQPSPVSITEIEPESWFAVYARRPSGVIAIPFGSPPTGRVCRTVLSAVSITETVFAWRLVTNARRPSGVIATLMGSRPTGIVARVAKPSMSITVTVPRGARLAM